MCGYSESWRVVVVNICALSKEGGGGFSQLFMDLPQLVPIKKKPVSFLYAGQLLNLISMDHMSVSPMQCKFTLKKLASIIGTGANERVSLYQEKLCQRGRRRTFKVHFPSQSRR